jgi:hypothetical protein
LYKRAKRIQGAWTCRDQKGHTDCTWKHKAQ